MNKDSKIFVAGHKGMVGSAIVRELQNKGFSNILVRERKELDLTNQAEVDTFFENETPEYVFLAAAKVGGIIGNSTYPADFIYDNIVIASNIIHAAHIHKTTKLLFLGSSCIYPKHAPQPMKEDCLLTGVLEPTNEPYAIAKIAGIKLCQAYKKQYGDDFISVMPTNLYGSGDNYHPHNSHVLPAMIKKFHEAKEGNLPTVTLWGTGTPMREFLHADDLANACVYLMNTYSDYEQVNIGTGVDISIRELAETVKKVVGYDGDIVFDTTKPDGAPRKLLDMTKLHTLGWKHSIDLQTGIEKTYRSFLSELENGTIRGLSA
jgi:GDP-L-fucose synthase